MPISLPKRGCAPLLSTLVISVAVLMATNGFSQQVYWPTTGWRISSPEAQGLDSATLADALGTIRQRRLPIHSLLLVRNGYIVLDAYFYPFAAGELHDLASATKSITSTLIGIAIGEGRLAGVEQPVLSEFSGASVSSRDARKEHLTLEDLLTMRSGLDCRFDHGELTLNQMRASAHWVPFMLNLPMVSDPGSTWVYCSGGMHVLSGVISRVTGRNAFAFAQEKLFAPLGIRDASWPSDPDGVSDGWGDLHLQPRDMAKIGYLWLHLGVWEDREIVPRNYLRAATQPQSHAPEYGYGFWVYQNRRPAIFANLGRVFEAQGRGGQRILVIPEKNMVVVMTGGGFEPADVGALLFPALKSDDQLRPDSRGVNRLAAASLAATKPPSPHPAEPLPSVARSISGKVYLLNENGLGLKSLSLSFTGAPPTLSLGFMDGRTETRPVGFDGIPRVSPSHDIHPPATSTISIDGDGDSSVAVSGAWEDDHTVALDYDTVGNIQDYRIHLVFRDRQVEVKLRERTGLIAESVQGHVR